MDTIKLRHFCSVVETGSLTKAAKLNGITHPGIHKSLKSLESELGISLTTPEGRGISISPDGNRIYQMAIEVLKKSDELFQSATSKNLQIFKLGITELFSFNLPGRILAGSSKCSFSFHERCPGEMEPNIASGYLNCGITTLPISHSGINFKEISSTSFSLFSSKELALNDKLTFITPSSLFKSKHRDHWKEQVYPRKNIVEVNMLSIAIELMKSGVGALFIPNFLGNYINSTVPRSRKMKKISIPSELQVNVPIYLMTRVGEKKCKNQENIINSIQSL